MKTKLFVTVIFAAFAVWSFAVSPTTRSLEQRVSELEQIVSQQQAELNNLRPLGEALHVSPYFPVLFCNFPLYVESDIVLSGSIYCGGELIFK